MGNNVRAQAARKLAPVIRNKGSLDLGNSDGDDIALLREICYGSLRLYPRLNALLTKLLKQPLKDRDADIQALLIAGLYQLFYMRVPDHAVLDQSVRATIELKKKWAKGLVNAVLRNALRSSEKNEATLADNTEYQFAHPQWMIDDIRRSWPDHANDVFEAANQKPPMVLRVNRQKTSTEEYAARLADAEIEATVAVNTPSAIRLASPVTVSALPDFSNGYCSVQDEAAQWAAEILAPEPKQRVLDACAAPGGKTGHLLEREPTALVTAIDVNESRTGSIRENLSRLDLQAEVICADAAVTESWWDGTAFQRILIDAPCSGTGVIRRHPDIKLLRRPSDIQKFSEQQTRLLDSLWPLLDRDGLLLYVTCSIMPEENDDQMRRFTERTPDAVVEQLGRDVGIHTKVGQQSLPRVAGPDGFYFSLVRKK